MSSIDAIVDVPALSEWLGLQTMISKDCLVKQLTDWTYHEQRLHQLSAKCKRFKAAFEEDPTFFGKCHTLFQEVAQIEKQLNALVQNESKLEQITILFFIEFSSRPWWKHSISF